MKGQILARLRSTPCIQKADIVLVFAAALLWLTLIWVRPWVIEPRCKTRPESCQASAVLSFDQPALKMSSVEADLNSDLTQGISGYLGVGIPAGWSLASAVLGRITPAVALATAGVDLVLFAQTAALNGLSTELMHAITQRPRPFVYASPTLNENTSNYTSFYSGHTSFAAAANVAVFLILLSRRAPRWLLALQGATGLFLIFSTGAFRVLAGRHFPTDVVFGVIAGISVALGVALLHREVRES